MKKQILVTIPRKAKEAIDALQLTSIMKGKAFHLVNIILQKGRYEAKDYFSFIPLPSRYLEKIFTKKYNDNFFNRLKQSGIIECNEFYIPGKEGTSGVAKGYRINIELILGDFVPVTYHEIIKTKDISIEGIHRYKETDTHYNMSPSPHICTHFSFVDAVREDLSCLSIDENRIIEAVMHALNNDIEKIKVNDAIGIPAKQKIHLTMLRSNQCYYVDFGKAMSWCDSYNSLMKDGKRYFLGSYQDYITRKRQNKSIYLNWVLANLRNKIYYINRNPTNSRLDHNITNLSKAALNILMDDNELIEIDIRNSQFAVHAHWLKEEKLGLIHEDIKTYCGYCQAGLLYDKFADMIQSNGKEDKRERAKNIMMEVAFSTGIKNSEEKKLFAAHFPNVWYHIKSFKQKHGKSMFAIELQRREAALVIDQIYLSIKNEKVFCLTKHDAIIVRRKDKDKVLTAINACFKKKSFCCALRVNDNIFLIGQNEALLSRAS